MVIHRTVDGKADRAWNLAARASLCLAVAAALGAVLAGCETSPAASQGGGEQRPTTAPAAAWWTPPEKSGAQLWADNCQRCHNMQQPDRFSDSQWDAIVHHMRLR